jgi:predicted AAA+ superfamily ATPase
MPENLLPVFSLGASTVVDLGRQNPWWAGESLGAVPAFRRWPFDRILARLKLPLAPILVIRGPRQIGKTTLQMQVIRQLLDEGVDPRRLLRVQFDEIPSLSSGEMRVEPILRVADWFERSILGKHFNAAADEGRPAFLFFDEVQNLPDWDAQLKSLVDHAKVRVLVTGSSALRIEMGRDSLAGRIQTLEVGPLRLTEIASFNGIGTLRPMQAENGWAEWTQPDFWHGLNESCRAQAEVLTPAFKLFSDRGGYPLAQNPVFPWPEVADQLNETVIRRVINHDLRIGDRGRKRDARLLEEVFRMACRYAGQSPNPATLAAEAKQQLSANIGAQRIRHYIDFLDQSLLIRAIRPLEIRLKKRKGFSKLVLCDHALRAAWLQELVPLDPASLSRANESVATLAGRIAESALGYYLSSLTGLDVAHIPDHPGNAEIDFVLTIGDRRLPLEVKYRRRLEFKDFAPLQAFLDLPANNAPTGLVITQDFGGSSPDPRIVCVPLQAILTVR